MSEETTSSDGFTNAEFTYVDTTSALAEMVAILEPESRIAVDTEADSLHHYFQKVCLIQITASDRHWLVDPLSIASLSALIDLFSQRKIILHGCDYDLRLLRGFYNYSPKEPVFDTMLASQLLGYSHVGLAALVEKFTGVVLSKQGQKSDWSRRPLTPSQLAYAVEDTRYLDLIANELEDQLVEKGRLEWHLESCAAVVNSTAIKREIDPDRRWRIKGLKDFSRRQLAYVRGVWHWRDANAQRADIPAFKILTNEKILELALWADELSEPITFETFSINGAPRLPRTYTMRRKTDLSESIMQARKIGDDDCPEFPKRFPPPPDKKKEIEALRTGCAKIAAGLELEPFIVAPRAAVESIVRNEPQSIGEVVERGYLLNWQTKLVAEVIAKVVPGFSSS